MRRGEKCYCGHAMKSHGSFLYGVRVFLACNYCDCIVYSEKSVGKEEWERLNRNRSDYAHLPLPSRISDIERIETESAGGEAKYL